MSNKFGFNEDYGIYCMGLSACLGLSAIARERKEAAEAEAKAAIEKREAINSVFSMIADALSYLDKDIAYLTPDEISEQFFHSLVEVNNVPVNIVEAAANGYLDCKDCSDTVKCALESMIDKCCKTVE